MHKLWKAHRDSSQCSIACTSCPVVKQCAKDPATIK
ncbi:MAG: hypothetical protein ACOC14_06235, partial [Bacillota bacterium]